MAQPTSPSPCLRFAAIFSRHVSALDWARQQIESHWGSICLTSARFEHAETEYYAADMGRGLRKQFLVLEPLYDPAQLATHKLESNAWEHQISQQPGYDVPRPLNIDPGYLTLSKIVLASAKDRAHRIYLRDGIYAEECLYYLGKRWQARPWTYPDYQREDFQAFFSEARELLKRTLQTHP